MLAFTTYCLIAGFHCRHYLPCYFRLFICLISFSDFHLLLFHLAYAIFCLLSSLPLCLRYIIDATTRFFTLVYYFLFR